MGQDDNPLKKRIEQLEGRLTELHRAVEQIKAMLKGKLTEPPTSHTAPQRVMQKPESVPPPPPRQSQVPPPQPARVTSTDSVPSPQTPTPAPIDKSFQLPEHMRKAEYWLGRAGIGLLLFGVAFLFKYSVDQGWLTPWVRIGFGLALGVVLLVIGLRIYSQRRPFSLLLLGGAIATFYISGFSAYQLFELIPHTTAFGFMVLVTLLGFFLSLRQDEAILSLLATIGGLGTPFMLYTSEGNIPGLIGYTCLILTGSTAVYFFRDWRSLMWLSVIGGWSVFLIGLYNCPLDLPLIGDTAINDQWALQLACIFGLIAFWIVPVSREVAQASHPNRWSRPGFGFVEKSFSVAAKDLLNRHVHFYSISTPLIALIMTGFVWSLSDESSGLIAVCGAVAYWLVSWGLRKWDTLKNLAYTHALVGLLLFTFAICLLLEGDTLLFALAAEGAVLHLIARRLSDRGTAICGHILFGVIAVWLAVRLGFEPQSGNVIFNTQALTELWAVAMALVVAFSSRSYIKRDVYLVIAAAALGGIFIRELNNNNILLLSLTAEATLLHLVARRLSAENVVVAAHLFLAGLGGWLLFRLSSAGVESPAVLNLQALSDLAVVAVAVGLTLLFRSTEERTTYRLVGHAAILLWLFRELGSFPNGQGYVTIAWGVYAIGLLIVGLRKNYHRVRQLALVTLLLVVGKLFLVDLGRLETIWRVLLFIGFGGLFLLLSYYFRSLWKTNDQPSD